MSRNAEETRKKILASATAEFAQFGIAGARVDRIAATAGCNKAMLYAYFGNKEQLFDAVFESIISEVLEGVPIDANNLPEYAGRLFDLGRSRPDLIKLNLWRTLERSAPEHASAIEQQAMQTKVAAIVRAQEAGIVTKRFPPEQVLLLVLKMASIGSEGSPEGCLPHLPAAAVRNLIVEAVKALVND
ncbi:TetR family transcriptional regulator [Pseudoduganella sp. RAF53_2]|uniref:TetR family transcriptional regulator n=1 Tax=unclassified Pseudoduganella TaxID=2637179 RepID=UPI003F981E28